MNLFVGATSFLFCVSFLFLFPSVTFAKIEIYNTPAKIEVNKEFELDVSLSNLSDPTHFLSIAFHKKSGDPYFGQTKNGDSWIEADDNNCKTFPQITVIEGTWSGKLVGKFSYNEKDFDNTIGDYILKVFKYTDSCNKSSSNDIMVALFDPSPPSSPTPISISPLVPTRIHTPTNTPVVPKPSNTPVGPKVTLSPTKIPSPFSSPTFFPSLVSITMLPSVTKSIVLGEVIHRQSTIPIASVASGRMEEKENSNKLVFPLFFLGVTCIVASCILGYFKIKKSGKGITFFS